MSETTKEATQKRCESQGHEWENCCSILFEVYQRCKWCGIRQYFR